MLEVGRVVFQGSFGTVMSRNLFILVLKVHKSYGSFIDLKHKVKVVLFLFMSLLLAIEIASISKAAS